MTEPVRRKWRGIEPDARTAERRQRLIDAAIDLLSTEGLSGTTVRAVCARAGLHSRYFYESFEDIDTLLVAVFDQLSASFLEEVSAAAEAAPDDPKARLQAAVQKSAEIVTRQTHLVRILNVEAIGNEQLNRRRIRMLHDIAWMIEQDAYRVYGAPAQGEQIGTLSARFLAAGFAELLIAWVGGELDAEAEELAADATELMLAVSEKARQLALSRAAERPRTSRRSRGTA
ncbi:MAG TPA: TetR/AcrR family transcriptional regulator [Acidimicrobiales bacterium]